MNFFRAIAIIFYQQLKLTAAVFSNLTMHLMVIPMVVIYAWLAQHNTNPMVLTYLLIGAPLMSIWNGAVFRTGWSLSGEIFGRTFDFLFIARTKVLIILFGRALAETAYGIPAGALVLGIMLTIMRTLPEIANIGLFFVSLGFMIFSIAVTSLLFAPMMVLAAGRGGFFNAIMPFGVVLSGFLFPVERLPLVLEVLSRFIPTSWAMQGIRLSIQGTESLWPLLYTWFMCGVLSIVLFSLTFKLFNIVEKRIRVTGILTTY